MTKTIVILQSNYIPWKGYFDLLAVADEFLIFDEVQYTRRDWRNRNKIILNGAPLWLSIAVQAKGNYETPIEKIEVADRSWAEKHWITIQHAYRRAPHFTEIESVLKEAYEAAAQLDLLTQINELFLRRLSDWLQLTPIILRTSLIPRAAADATGRLLEICVARGATEYISGPAARAYIDKERFAALGLKLKYANYSGYPVYPQASTSFEHGVSMIDTIMQCGLQARGQLKSLQDRHLFLDAP